MAHELDFSLGRAGMAYIGETPSHSLGEVMQEGQSLDQWRVAAGLDWEAKRQKISFTDEGQQYLLQQRQERLAVGAGDDRARPVGPGGHLRGARRLPRPRAPRPATDRSCR